MNTWPFSENLKLAATKNAPYWARRLVVDVLEGWRMSDLRENAQLLTSELVTNAVNAVERMPFDPIRRVRMVKVNVYTDYRCVLVEVWDPTNDVPAVQNMVPDDVEGGRGLFLVDTIAKEWGYYFTRGGGKIVWCLLEMPAHQPNVAYSASFS